MFEKLINLFSGAKKGKVEKPDFTYLKEIDKFRNEYLKLFDKATNDELIKLIEELADALEGATIFLQKKLERIITVHSLMHTDRPFLNGLQNVTLSQLTTPDWEKFDEFTKSTPEITLPNAILQKLIVDLVLLLDVYLINFSEEEKDVFSLIHSFYASCMWTKELGKIDLAINLLYGLNKILYPLPKKLENHKMNYANPFETTSPETTEIVINLLKHTAPLITGYEIHADFEGLFKNQPYKYGIEEVADKQKYRYAGGWIERKYF